LSTSAGFSASAYLPFAAALFGAAARAPEGVLAAVITAASIGALITRRVRAAATAAAAFAATVALGAVLLPSPSRVFWLDGVFNDQNRIGDPANLAAWPCWRARV
jgi:hypothetical protein